MEPFESALKTFDADKDGKLSRAEYATEKGFGEHFGWVDADGNDSLDEAEYNDARAMGIGEYGVAALSPAGLQRQGRSGRRRSGGSRRTCRSSRRRWSTTGWSTW